MKQLLTLLFVAISAATFAQAPQGINYQAVIRDNGGAILANQAVGMKVAILQGSPTGTAVYEESFSPTTSQFGLVNLVIGQGTVISGDFTTIDWSAGPYYAEVSADETGGTSYSVLGTQQLISVPYALYAKTAENVTNDQVDDADADPTNEIQDISLTGTDLTISSGSTVDLSVIQDGTGTDDQTLTLTGTDLSIESGNTVDLSVLQDGVTDADADPANELQDWSTLPGIPGDFADDIDNVDDADNDPTNEIETWTTLGGMPAGFADDIDDVDDADNDPTNELQALSLSNDTLYLSNGNNVYIGNVGGGSGNPPGFPDGFNNMLPIFGANSGCMTWGSEDNEHFVDGIVQADGGMLILARQESDYVLFRTNALGEVVRKIGFRSTGYLNSFCQNPVTGDLYFTGSYNNDFRVSMTDSMGVLIGHYGWSNLGEGEKIIFGSDNNLYVLAQCAAPYGVGGIDVVVAKINLSGTVLNKLVYGTSNNDSPIDLIQLADGNLLILWRESTGNAVVTKFTTNFSIIWSRQLNTTSVAGTLLESSEGSIYVGYNGASAARFAKLAQDGIFIAGKTYTFPTNSPQAYSFIQKSQDSLVLVGRYNITSGANAGFIMYLDTLGNIQESYYAGSTDPYMTQFYEKAYYINSHLYVFGRTDLYGWGNDDVSGTKFDLNNMGCCLNPLSLSTANSSVNSVFSGLTGAFTLATQGVNWFNGFPVMKVYSECYQD